MARIEDATDEELQRYAAAIRAEQDRRRTLATAASHMAELNRQYLTAEGIQQGEPWRQPAGAHNSYPAGWEATHAGKTWVSDSDGNAWEPPTGWTEKTAEGQYPEWVQPGGHNPYSTGDRVMYQGVLFESLIDGNGWSPDAYPAGWKRVEGDA